MAKNLSPQLRGTIELSIASVGFGFLGIFGKIAFNSGLSVGEFLTYRFLLASLLLWIFMLLAKPGWIRLSWTQMGLAALLGFFGYAVFSTLYFKAVEGVSVALAALLLYTYPFWVSIFSHFFSREKLTRSEILCLFGASAGLALLLWGHIEVTNALAIFSGLGAALTYAIYILTSAHYQKTVRPLSSSLYVITFAALGLWLFHRPALHQVTAMTPAQASSVFAIAVLSTILPLTLVLAGLQKMSSRRAALLTMIEPLTAAVMGAIIFKEMLSLSQLAGALLIALCLYLNTRLMPVAPTSP